MPNNKKYIKLSKFLIILFIISFMIRLGFGIHSFMTTGTSNFGDDWDYISSAKNIISQGIWFPDISRLRDSCFGPGFPIVISFLFLIFGENYLPIVIFNAIISAFITILIFHLGKIIFNEKVGLLASIWSIFYILFIRYVPRALKEVWVIFLFALVILLIIKATKKTKYLIGIPLVSALFSFLIHSDERFFVYFPFIIIALIIFDRSHWKNGLKKALVFFFIVIIAMLPWFVRNYNVYKRPVILTERTTKFTDKIFGYKTSIMHKTVFDKQAYADSILRGDILQNPGQEGSERRYQIDLIKQAVEMGYTPHKFTLLKLWYGVFKEFWRPVRFTGGLVADGYKYRGPSWSLKHNLSQGLTYGLLLPFFLIGIYFMIKKRNNYAIFIFSIIVIHTVLHVIILTHGRNRYRIPLDPFIMVLAANGFLEIFKKLKFNITRINKINKSKNV